ncbi:hypothetical protein WN67_10995 [Mycolicibacterium obuense]|uniref:Helix-turn-helix domain-containing protein n=2 Tax=Mycolicibacterium obuense TaxID=1807 RepID=A0A0M2K446_9MYCO|nr:hypothetical protein WN67_10995 [Mycolicibacterium obuense]
MMRVEIPEYILGGILYGISHFIHERDRAGIGVRPEVRSGHQWLITMSAVGPQSDCEERELEPDDLIGTAQAAALLGCTERHVRRIQADLDGVRPAGRSLVFSRRQVLQYAAAREEHRK